MKNRVCDLFSIKYPIIQGGMVWCAGWELASAVSHAGGLGIIGSGSMYPEILRDQIKKCKEATSLPFAVNIPLLYPSVQEHIQTVIDLEVPIVFTSAGSPNSFTSKLKSHGITVVHVVSSVKFALKSEAAGVDAVVAEGFEAGGHNGREETTTMCLIPSVAKACSIPVIAAGGISDGKSVLASMILGAEGAQLGSRFVASEESSAH
ncbi:nitronate monooxygenase, partial [Flavobacteriales bacterium]|nr:nitronate monooxygenase [Flavobacteriales bacterium]